MALWRGSGVAGMRRKWRQAVATTTACRSFLCPMPLVPPCPGLSPAYGCRGAEAWMEQDEGLPAVGAYACLMLAGSFSHLSGMLFSARPRRGTPCIRPRRGPVPAPARQHWWWLLEAFFAKCRGIGLCLHNSLCAWWLAKRPVLQCRTGRLAMPCGRRRHQPRPS